MAGRRLCLRSADTDAARLDDHQCTPELFCGEGREPAAEDGGFPGGSGVGWETGHDDSGVSSQGESERVREPLIAGNERPSLPDGISEDSLIDGCVEADVPNVNDVIAPAA